MNLKCCKNLVVLNEVELKECNGGSTVFNKQKSLIPDIIIQYPVPDGDHRL